MSLVVCLDSGCGNYDRCGARPRCAAWSRGNLVVEVLKEGVHSGDASGIVASSFRIARNLLSRVEDPETGKILLDKLHVKIPKERARQAKATAKVLGKAVYSKFPWVEGMQPMTKRPGRADAQPHLAADALGHRRRRACPDMSSAGNVLRPKTALKLSVRLPPTRRRRSGDQEAQEAAREGPALRREGALRGREGALPAGTRRRSRPGWRSRSRSASKASFGKDACYMGEGGSIPFMGMLGKKFPKAQFLITGVLGPALERARAERVPARADGQEVDGLRGARDRGPLRARGGFGRRGAGREEERQEAQEGVVLPYERGRMA